MTGKGRHTVLCGQAAEVQRIAQGIFDKGERRTVLRFVAEAMKLSKEKGI